MRAIIVTDPKSYSVVQMPATKPGDDEVLVKVQYCAICASDFEILEGLNEEEVVYPIIPGHEWSGEVVEAGENFQHLLGKRVIADNAVPCGRCPACRKGKFHICNEKQEIGFSLNGAYAEYLLAPGKNIVELPNGVDSRHASLSEPLSTSARDRPRPS